MKCIIPVTHGLFLLKVSQTLLISRSIASAKGILFFSMLSVITLSMLSISPLFASNIGDSYGFSPTGMALGNAMTARVDDWSSVYYNMAGLGRTAGRTLNNLPEKSGAGISLEAISARHATESRAHTTDIALSYFRTVPDLKIDIRRYDENGGSLSTNGDDIPSYGYTVLGLAVDLRIFHGLPHFISSARIGLGLGLNDDLSVTKLNDVNLKAHNFIRYGREAQRTMILGGLGLGFMNDLAGIGVGANIYTKGSGVVHIKEINMTPDPQYPEGESRMDMSGRMAFIGGMYLSPGRLFAVLDGLHLGIAYRQENYREISPFKTLGFAVQNSIHLEMIMAMLDYYQPHIVSSGISYSRGGYTVSFDAEYQMWSGYTVNISTAINNTELPELRDIMIYHAGLEWQPDEWFSLMTGFCYQPSFVSAKTQYGPINFLDNDKYIGSMGARFMLPDRWLGFYGRMEITVAYQMQYLAEKRVIKINREEPYYGYNPDYSYEGINHSMMLGVVMKM